MPVTWRLLTDDADERRAFVDLAATRAWPNMPAAPPNRLRHVMRITANGRNYFLKSFTRTQWKNQLHFRLSQPTARDDAERELRVTQILRERGFVAPRPIAYGRDGASSYYLCAELPGEALAELLRRGAVDEKMARAVADHCGRLLAAGFRLPDLSCDHVFVDRPPEGGRGPLALSVLDLHNGGLGSTGRTPSPKLLGRVLRRFSRSVRGLAVARGSAMRFALRLLRAAGAPRPMRRRLLTAAQPFGTAARYEQGDRSARYAGRNPERARREAELLQRVWPGRPGELVLDLPCGAGRLLPFLRAHRHRVVQADGALAMLQQTRTDGLCGELCAQADALAMPFADGAVDGVVMFRFLHHLPPDVARQAMAEACRVARRFVVVSFFHPASVHHAERRLRQLLGSPAVRFAMRLGTLEAIAKRHGFGLVRHAAQLPYARDLWVAALERRSTAAN